MKENVRFLTNCFTITTNYSTSSTFDVWSVQPASRNGPNKTPTNIRTINKTTIIITSHVTFKINPNMYTSISRIKSTSHKYNYVHTTILSYTVTRNNKHRDDKRNITLILLFSMYNRWIWNRTPELKSKYKSSIKVKLNTTSKPSSPSSIHVQEYEQID